MKSRKTRIDKANRTFNGVNIIAHRKIWYSLSLIILLPLLAALLVFGLRLGVDFTGGAIIEIQGSLSPDQIKSIAESNGINNPNITTTEGDRQLIRYALDAETSPAATAFENQLRQAGATVVRSDQIGPSVSRDLAKNAFLSMGAMSLAIVLYISYAFRKTAHSVRPLQFGLATIFAAFLHDAVFVIGIFAVLGHFLQVEVDSFIITAILTVIGFSIHDTIVVFDRIREKLHGGTTHNFANTVEESLQETLVRSLNTSFIIILVLVALLLFGGDSTRYFILALLLGMLVGTYSSLFIAAPLLVSWHEWGQKRRILTKAKKTPKKKPPKKHSSQKVIR